jgi:adenylate cyclase
MPRNIEIKARIASVEVMLPRVRAHADQGPFEIDQDDTFFDCTKGRLKLRAASDQAGELIFYRRSDATEPKPSYFLRSPVPAVDALRGLLDAAYGTIGRVLKHRTLFMIGRTRVHLDRVAGLGDFLELEVMLGEGEAEASGTREAQELMQRLGVDSAACVAGAYVDLLNRLPADRSRESPPIRD